ncbi:MAG: glycosyltransferase [Chloroflexi bacterium]|jgi:glycosyltransferase involved in cell wall biosynthesis|nr:glycosyltransferase [Chloroflexota bacterium]
MATRIEPTNTVFVILSFEGPDIYSQAGGLGVRVTELADALAEEGYETHLIFVGDPSLPSNETLRDGKLFWHRWSQWISSYHPHGVYEGEDDKVRDFNHSVPWWVVNDIARPAAEQGKLLVVLAEEWHTAYAACELSDRLNEANLRWRSVILWNANNVFSFHRINWGRLNYATTITTVSRYMKHRMWQEGVNPLVIPNGIPKRALNPVDPKHIATFKEIVCDRFPLLKIGRFDPDKRWMMAAEAVVALKNLGVPVLWLMRGGLEPHGRDVMGYLAWSNANISQVTSPTRRPTIDECFDLLRQNVQADVLNLSFFLPEEFVRILYAGCAATMANSGHEPFGLVGLEVMAARGIAVVGSTGEDYATFMQNALVTETSDPAELVEYLLEVRRNPELADRLREAGYQTAEEFVWPNVLADLRVKVEYLARRQGALQ